MLPDWTIIGFTGHRRLQDAQIALSGIRAALHRVAERCGPLGAITPIAAGADTLFVEEISARSLPFLLVLPFAPERFQRDFEPEQWQRIQPLLEQSLRTEQVGACASDNEAHLETGQRVVDRANVLLAVWDGKPAAGLGGTGDIVSFARALGKPLIWVHSETGAITEERLEQLPAKLDGTALHLPPREVVEKHFHEMDDMAKSHAPKARYLILAIIWLHLFVSTLGLIVLIWHIRDFGNIGRAVAEMAIVAELGALGLALWLASLHHRRHDAWLKNRIEAEICRSTLASWRVPLRSDDAAALALNGFDAVCRNLWFMCQRDRSQQVPIETVRDEYLADRLLQQLTYFSRQRDRAEQRLRRCRLIAWVSTVLAFLGTLCVLLMIIFDANSNGFWLDFFKSLSLILPLVSAASFSIIVTQEYARRSARFREMVERLEMLKRRLEAVKTSAGLVRVVTAIESELLQEVVEWHSYTRFAAQPH